MTLYSLLIIDPGGDAYPVSTKGSPARQRFIKKKKKSIRNCYAILKSNSRLIN